MFGIFRRFESSHLFPFVHSQALDRFEQRLNRMLSRGSSTNRIRLSGVADRSIARINFLLLFGNSLWCAHNFHPRLSFCKGSKTSYALFFLGFFHSILIFRNHHHEIFDPSLHLPSRRSFGCLSRSCHDFLWFGQGRIGPLSAPATVDVRER